MNNAKDAADYIYNNAQYAFDLTFDDDYNMFIAVCASLTVKMHGVYDEDFNIMGIYKSFTGMEISNNVILEWELHCLKAIDWKIPF